MVCVSDSGPSLLSQLTSWAASSAAENLSLETQEEEENFDLAFLASLEIDITPHLGDPRVSASLVSHLSRVLQEGSKLYDFAMTTSGGAPDEDDKTRASSSRRTSETLFYVEDRDYELGTTHLGIVVPRERFSYWCFDLLFLICSDTARGVFKMAPPPLTKLNAAVALTNRSRGIEASGCCVEYIGASEPVSGNTCQPCCGCRVAG